MRTIGRTAVIMTLAFSLVGGLGHIAEAKNNNHGNHGHSEEAHEKHKDADNKNQHRSIPWPMRIEISLTGKATLTGTVQSVNGSTFNLQSWGGTWTITTASTTKFTHKDSVSNIRVGDIVTVKGRLASTSPAWTLNALEVNNKNWRHGTATTTPATGTTTAQTSLQFATVQSTGSTTLGVRLNNGQTYTVQTSTSTSYFNHILQPITFSQILIGHMIAAYGTTTSSSTLNASIIHDLSL